MVKCPKCGAKGWLNYCPIVTLDTDYDGDTMIQTNEVECTGCHHQYIVKEVFELSLENSYNID